MHFLKMWTLSFHSPEPLLDFLARYSLLHNYFSVHMSQELYLKDVIKIIVNHLQYKLITALDIEKMLCGWDMIDTLLQYI